MAKKSHKTSSEKQSINWILAVRIGILIALHAVGVVGFSVSEWQPLFKMLIPYHLLLISFVLYFEKSSTEPLFWLFFVLALVIGFGAEVFGVQSGLLFGYYSYTDVLGFSILQVPVVIGVLWASVAYASNVIAIRLFPNNKWFSILTAALLMVSIDYLIEPFAIQQQMWIWHMNEIPLYNYISWFIVGAIISIIFHYTLYVIVNEVATYFVATQVFFFIALQVIIRNWGVF